MVVFSGCMPSNKMAGSYDSSIFSFLRNLHAVLHSGRINLHSHNSVRGFPFPSYSSVSEFMYQDGLSYTNNNNAKISGVHKDKDVLFALTTRSSQSAIFLPPRPRWMEQPLSGTLLVPTAEGKSAG